MPRWGCLGAQAQPGRWEANLLSLSTQFQGFSVAPCGLSRLFLHIGSLERQQTHYLSSQGSEDHKGRSSLPSAGLAPGLVAHHPPPPQPRPLARVTHRARSTVRSLHDKWESLLGDIAYEGLSSQVSLPVLC